MRVFRIMVAHAIIVFKNIFNKNIFSCGFKKQILKSISLVKTIVKQIFKYIINKKQVFINENQVILTYIKPRFKIS